MAVAYLTRIVHFKAVHRYHRPEWSAERNAEAFGEAGLDHGHEYLCQITVRGTPDPVTGMVMDLGQLDRILREEVVERFDDRHLDRDVPEFAYGRTVPTGEMLAVHVWERVAGRLPHGCALSVVRVQEDAALWAEYRGEA